MPLDAPTHTACPHFAISIEIWSFFLSQRKISILKSIFAPIVVNFHLQWWHFDVKTYFINCLTVCFSSDCIFWLTSEWWNEDENENELNPPIFRSFTFKFSFSLNSLNFIHARQLIITHFVWREHTFCTWNWIIFGCFFFLHRARFFIFLKKKPILSPLLMVIVTIKIIKVRTGHILCWDLRPIYLFVINSLLCGWIVNGFMVQPKYFALDLLHCHHHHHCRRCRHNSVRERVLTIHQHS